MKARSLLLILLFACSCSGERVESVGDTQGSRINFSTRFAEVDATKGAVLTGPAALAARGGFDVWAVSHPAPWSTGPAKETLLDNVKVTGAVSGSSVVWSSASGVMWPEDRYVSFFAYGPAGSAATGAPTAAGSPTLAFGVNTIVSNQEDFVIAKPVYDQTAVSYSGSKPVNLFFNHALSRIVLSGILLNGDERVISVKSVTLDGLYHTGSVDLGAAATAWDVDETSTAGYVLSAGSELTDAPLSSTATKLTTGEGYLFLLPQTLARTPGPTMEVVLTVDGMEKTHSAPVFTPVEWLPGKSYNYQIVVDGDDLRLVLVSVDDLTLADWNVTVMIQPVPLTNNADNDLKRLYSALSALGHLNQDPNDPPPTACDYFSIYLMNDVSHNITVSMDGYEAMFTEGEYVIFDGRKIVNTWESGFTFTVNYNSDYWTLEPALQNVSDPLDASTGATATSETTPPVAQSITTYGSVIVKRNAAPAPATP